MDVRSAKLELREGDRELGYDEFRRMTIFQGLDEAAARRLARRSRGAVVLRKVKAGQVLFRQGEAGWTAFYLPRRTDLQRLRGSMHDTTGDSSGDTARLSAVEALLEAAASGRPPLALVYFEARSTGALPRNPEPQPLRNLFYRWRRRSGEAAATPRDTGGHRALDLEGQQPLAQLYAGELFGEMSCFTHAPRSATVAVAADGYIIEMVRHVLEALLSNPSFREALEEVYRRRVLSDLMRSIPLLADAPENILEQLRVGTKLRVLQPGELLFTEGQPAEALVLIRHGALELRRASDPSVTYLSTGESVGARQLFSSEPWPFSAASLSDAGAGRAEVVEISKAALDRATAADPGWQAQLMKRANTPDLASRPVAHLAAALGLTRAERLLLFDLDRCTRCDDCVRACAESRADGIARLRRTGPRFGRFLVPRSCRQCFTPACLAGCPVGSIHRGPRGEIVIEDWCIGCGLCAEQCPYDAIELVVRANGGGRRAVTCDQCESLTPGPPLCVLACGADAARRGPGEELLAAGGFDAE